MKGDSSLCATNDCRLAYVCLPDCTALFGTLPRGREPPPPQLAALGLCSSEGTEVAQAEPKAWRCLGLHQHLQGGLFGKRSASGGSRGAGIKRRTPQGHPQARTVGGWFVHGGRDVMDRLK